MKLLTYCKYITSYSDPSDHVHNTLQFVVEFFFLPTIPKSPNPLSDCHRLVVPVTHPARPTDDGGLEGSNVILDICRIFK